MDLSQFSSYVELMTGVCIAYAGSKIFREGIEETIIKQTNRSFFLNLRIDKLLYTLMIKETSGEHPTITDKAKRKLNNLTSKLEVLQDSYENESRSRKFYDLIFKILFVYSALYGVLFLYQLGCHAPKPSHIPSVQVLTSLSMILNLVYLILFILSIFMSEERIFKVASISLPYKIATFLVICILSYFVARLGFLNYVTTSTTYFMVSIFLTTTLPFILYFVKLHIEVLKINKEYDKDFKEIRKSISDIAGTLDFAYTPIPGPEEDLPAN